MSEENKQESEKADKLGIVRWSAWGVFDIDKADQFDRLQRRNHIKKVREAMTTASCNLHCGGSTKKPYYRVTLPDGKKKAFAGEGAFRKACELVLTEVTGDLAPAQAAEQAAGQEVE